MPDSKHKKPSLNMYYESINIDNFDEYEEEQYYLLKKYHDPEDNNNIRRKDRKTNEELEKAFEEH